MTITIWHNAKCATSRKVLDAIRKIAAMAKHPILIERPVVRARKGTRLCRPPERLKEIL